MAKRRQVSIFKKRQNEHFQQRGTKTQTDVDEKIVLLNSAGKIKQILLKTLNHKKNDKNV